MKKRSEPDAKTEKPVKGSQPQTATEPPAQPPQPDSAIAEILTAQRINEPDTPTEPPAQPPQPDSAIAEILTGQQINEPDTPTEPPAQPHQPDSVVAEIPAAQRINEPDTSEKTAPPPVTEPASQPPAAEASPGSDGATASQSSALVIEDDFDASLIFSKALQAAGHQVEVIRAGDMAVKRLSEIVPQLVILDLHLPEVDGTEILSKIRADERLAKTRVIVVTADARMAEPIKEDADLVLLKPASYSQVRDFALRLSRRG